jgi:hypothetical protein
MTVERPLTTTAMGSRPCPRASSMALSTMMLATARFSVLHTNLTFIGLCAATTPTTKTRHAPHQRRESHGRVLAEDTGPAVGDVLGGADSAV